MIHANACYVIAVVALECIVIFGMLYRVTAWNIHKNTKTTRIVGLSLLSPCNAGKQVGLVASRWMSELNSHANDDNNKINDEWKHQYSHPTKRLAIVGGGLAGLSTAYHFLSKISKYNSNSCISSDDDDPNHKNNNNSMLNTSWNITIFDRHPIGMGGASSVAGGLIHPLSPTGKVVHWGFEGLTSTNELIAAAESAWSSDHDDDKDNDSRCSKTIVLRDELFRLVVAEHNNNNNEHSTLGKTNKQQQPNNNENSSLQMKQQLQTIAQKYPQFAEWLDSEAMRNLLPSTTKHDQDCHKNNSTILLGGLRLFNGCKAIHVPSYLQGLYEACQTIVVQFNTKQNTNNTSSSTQTKNHNTNNNNNATKGSLMLQLEWKILPQQQTAVVGSDKNKNNDDDNNATTPTTTNQFWKELLAEYDTVVFAAGSGMFHPDDNNSNNPTKKKQPDDDVVVDGSTPTKTNDYNISTILSKQNFPIELVTGQSIVMKLRQDDDDDDNHNNSNHRNNNGGIPIQQQQAAATTTSTKPFLQVPALLCGKYVSPMQDPSRVLIGATHEFHSNQKPVLSTKQVVSELKDRTDSFASFLWQQPEGYDEEDGDDDDKDIRMIKKNGSIEQITIGTRVQTKRGSYGRMPIIGKLNPSHHSFPSIRANAANSSSNNETNNDSTNNARMMIHPNAWIFTGLSSRGLLYHSLYGDILTDALLSSSSSCMDDDDDDHHEQSIHPRGGGVDLLWWKKHPC